MMKPIIIGLVLAVSLAVSISLIATMPDSTEVQPTISPESKTVQTKLYTLDDLADNPELYNISEAAQIISKTYNDLLKECKDTGLTGMPYFDCTDNAYSWWQDASLTIQRAYQP